MKNEDLKNKIEAVLFYSSEPMELSNLVKIVEEKRDEVKEALYELSVDLKTRGIRLIANGEEYSLVTAPEHSGLIEELIREERERDLGRAGIETLTIIAYKGPVSRREIEYIRGVNSQYVLRSLLLRGLVDRKTNKDDERQMVYSVTKDTIRFLGLENIGELPQYREMREQLEVDNQEKTSESEVDGE